MYIYTNLYFIIINIQMVTTKRLIEKIIICLCLVISIYFTIMCHCESPILSCKKYIFYLLVGVPIIYVWIMNMYS